MIPDDFPHDWQDAWNSHDLSRILAHYTDDVVFRSRKALALVGAGELRGKAELEAYWRAALKGQPDLRFDVSDVFQGHNMLVITYINHRKVRAAETLYFNSAGKVFMAAASHQI